LSKNLAKSTGIIGGLTLVSRILGFVREVMLAAAFGAGKGMDAFLVALMIPNFGRRMFAEGAFSQAFVPVFTETKTRDSHEAARDLTAVVMGTLGGVLSIITLVGCLAAPVLVWLFASGFSADPAKEALSANLLRWTFPYLMFISLTSMAGGVLNSYGRFAVPAFTPVILNVCIIATAFIDSESVQVLAYAVFAAGIFQFVFQLPQMASLGLLPRPRWGWHDPRVRRIVALMLPVMVGSSIAQISLVLNSNLSTNLGDGAVSWLYYANRLMEFPLGIFSIAIGTAILPTLSAHHTNQSSEQFSHTLDWALRTMLIIGLPAALGMVLLAGPLVATIYGHGHFSGRDIEMTTYALWAYSVGFMGFSFVKVLVPGFYARQETRLPVRFAVISLVIGMMLSVALFALAKIWNLPAAHAGLAASTSLTACLNSALLFRRLKRDGIYRPGAGWGTFSMRILLANAALIVVVVAMSGSLTAWIAMTTWLRAARLAIVILAAMAVYFGVLYAVGLRPRHLRMAPPSAV
jgi:putative peptidoglycan lipid II flippase